MEYSFNIPDYFVVKAMESIICQDLDCDYKVTDCMLEEMNIYLEKNKK